MPVRVDPRAFASGQIIRGAELNILRDSAITMRQRPSSVPEVGAQSASIVVPFVVHEDLGDVLHCYRIDWTGIGSELYYVAKPFILRQTPFDRLTRAATYIFSGVGGIVTYTYVVPGLRLAEAIANVGDETAEEYQTISPEYLEDDVIYATLTSLGDVEYDNENVIWIDDNRDSRAWLETDYTPT